MKITRPSQRKHRGLFFGALAVGVVVLFGIWGFQILVMVEGNAERMAGREKLSETIEAGQDYAEELRELTPQLDGDVQNFVSGISNLFFAAEVSEAEAEAVAGGVVEALLADLDEEDVKSDDAPRPEGEVEGVDSGDEEGGDGSIDGGGDDRSLIYAETDVAEGDFSSKVEMTEGGGEGEDVRF